MLFQRYSFVSSLDLVLQGKLDSRGQVGGTTFAHNGFRQDANFRISDTEHVTPLLS
ncbi:hypothetical protein RTCIAT899_PC00835 (plasmid) [Rhizobium tropici CIAT 899]|nr:hypothetical protein RTCIAT899_PC00835 [Rhizobium tropici CIAT 899]